MFPPWAYPAAVCAYLAIAMITFSQLYNPHHKDKSTAIAAATAMASIWFVLPFIAAYKHITAPWRQANGKG